MIKDIILEQTLTRIGQCKKSRKGWITRNCMLCVHRGHSADKRGRFGLVNEPHSMAIHCFNCRFKAKFEQGKKMSKDFSWFLNTIGVPPDDVRKLKFQAFRERDTLGRKTDVKLTGDPRDKWVEMELPQGSKPISEHLNNGCEDRNFLKVASYCVERGLDISEMMWTPDTELGMNKRVLMPFYYDGKVVGYSGRLYKDDFPKHMRKYLNVVPDDFVYNLDSQNYDRPFVIVYEGVIDAYLCDGISPMGTINDTQVALINSLGKRVIVCPDRDTEGQALIDVALKNQWEVSSPK